MYPSASDKSIGGATDGFFVCCVWGNGSSISVFGVGGHDDPSAVDPPVESCAIVLFEEYDVDSGGVGVWLSRKGSLGARGRFVCVVDAIGGTLLDRARGGDTETERDTSDGSGDDCDRECIGDNGVNGEYGPVLLSEGERLDAVSSKART